jgi:hypothetical protein
MLHALAEGLRSLDQHAEEATEGLLSRLAADCSLGAEPSEAAITALLGALAKVDPARRERWRVAVTLAHEELEAKERP